MKLNEQYKILKQEYSKHIILLPKGNFYTTFYDDSYILNYLLSYQLCDDKVGFPKNVLDKVLKKLTEKEINVYVKKEEPEIIENENNQYENILYLARKNYFNELNSKVLLEEISFLLKSNPENIQKIKSFINEL